MKYESTILKRLIDTYGVVGNPRYISEIIKEFIVRGKECFPNLFTYQADWLAHIDEFGLNPTYTVSYTGQSIYAPNTLERPVKSAILKGQTLVNIMKKIDKMDVHQSRKDDDTYIEGNYFVFDLNKTDVDVAQNRYMQKSNSTTHPLEQGKTYTLLINIEENISSLSSHTFMSVMVNFSDGSSRALNIKGDGSVGIQKFKFQAVLSEITTLFVYYYPNSEVCSGKIRVSKDIMLLEGDYTNVDIPYFEGMQSVKMPVLTTVGKNLFDGVIKENNYVKLVEYDSKQCVSIVARNKLEGLFEFTKPIPCTKGLKLSFMIKSASYCIIRPVFEDDTLGDGIGSWTGFPEWTKTFYTIPQSSKRLRGFVTVSSGNTVVSYLELSTIQIEQGTTATSYEPYKSNILTVNEDVTLRSNGDICDELNLLTGQLTQRIGEDGVVLSQEVVKTVELSILDQNGQSVDHLKSFNGGTYVYTSSLEGSLVPSVDISVVTNLEETLKICSLEGNTM